MFYQFPGYVKWNWNKRCLRAANVLINLSLRNYFLPVSAATWPLISQEYVYKC